MGGKYSEKKALNLAKERCGVGVFGVQRDKGRKNYEQTTNFLLKQLERGHCQAKWG